MRQNFVWELQWMFDGDTNPIPHKKLYPSKMEAIAHGMKLFADHRELTFLSCARRLG